VTAAGEPDGACTTVRRDWWEGTVDLSPRTRNVTLGPRLSHRRRNRLPQPPSSATEVSLRPRRAACMSQKAMNTFRGIK